MDAGFYRGTNADQDNRFTDKEKKLLKQMKFEDSLDKKIDLSKVNVEVIKPWITYKLNEILGMEDDVLVEYVFTQLEEKNINPKVMQINLTGFLNARKSREFMSDLWSLLAEAQASPDGIPAAIVEKKVQELKAAAAASNTGNDILMAKATETDWNHRYQSLTGGRYGKIQPSYNSESIEPRRRSRTPRDRSRDRFRDRSPRERFRERNEPRNSPPARSPRGGRRGSPPRRSPPPRRERDSPPRRTRRRSEERLSGAMRDRLAVNENRRRPAARHSSSISPPTTPPLPIRRFTENPERKRKLSADEKSVASSDIEIKKKKKKKKHRRHSSEEENGSDSETERKKSKKSKKEKKKKHKKNR